MSEWVESVGAAHRRSWLSALVIFALAGAALLFGALYLPQDEAGLIALGLVGCLAAVGALALFGLAVGLIPTTSVASVSPPFNDLVDGLDEACALVDRAGRVIFANHAYRQLTGSVSSSAILPPEGLFNDAPEAAQALFRLAAAARRAIEADEEIRLDQGIRGSGPAWYRVRTRPLSTKAGQALQFWRVTDVTRDRERQETVFRELQHAIEFLDHAPAGFFSLNPQGQIDYINATLATMIGRDLAETGTGGFPLSDLIVTSDQSRLMGLTGVAHDHRTDVIETELRHRSGEIIPVRLLHQVSFDATGRAMASRTLVIDRRTLSGKIEGSVDEDYRFSRLFNASPFGIALIDPDGKIVKTNPAFLRIIPQDAGGVGSLFAALFAQEDRDILAGLIDPVRAPLGTSAPVDLKLAHEGRSARAFVTRLHTGDPGTESVIVHLLDTTEQKALEAQFAQAQKMQAVGELAGGVAHDFNNVLQGILGYADLLLGNHRPTDPAFQDIMEIKNNVNRAADLVGHLLAFSRRQTLMPVVLRLPDTLAGLSRLLKRLMGFRINIDVKHDRDLWLVKADKTQFEQVIINLAMNAKDAMPDEGQFSIRTSNVAAASTRDFGDTTIPAADYVMIEIADSGAGIPPDLIGKIFEPFFTTKEVGKGTGLGLSMVYGFVKQSGGFILCESKPGEGTRFRILLPRHIPEASDRTASPSSAVEARAPVDLTGQGTILLVEDEIGVRAFGARALTQKGYQVLEAASGVEALAILERETRPIDLIVSDVVMPEMDGPTLLGEARARGITARFIFVSGYAEEAFRRNLPEGEEFGFLPKPFSLKQLIETVKSALE